MKWFGDRDDLFKRKADLRQLQFIPDKDKFFLHLSGKGDSLVFPGQPGFVFFFSGRVDAILTRSLPGIAELPQNGSGRLFKSLCPQESFRVNYQKEVAQVVGADGAVLVFPVQIPRKRPDWRAADRISTTVA